MTTRPSLNLLFATLTLTGCGAPPDLAPLVEEVPPEPETGAVDPTDEDAPRSASPVIGRPVSGSTPLVVSQGWNGSFSHNQPELRYAHDFGLESGTELVAPLTGEVRVCAEPQGSSSYWCHGFGLSILLVDPVADAAVVFGHLSEVLVEDGDFVLEGETIALSGGDPQDQPYAGFSTAPHLHLHVLSPAPTGNDFWIPNSIPFDFQTDSGPRSGGDWGVGMTVNSCAPSPVGSALYAATAVWSESVQAGVGTEELGELQSLSLNLCADLHPNLVSISAELDDGDIAELLISRRQGCVDGYSELGPWSVWLPSDGDSLPTALGGFSVIDAMDEVAAGSPMIPDSSPTEIEWLDVSRHWAAGVAGWGCEVGADCVAAVAWRHRWLRSWPWQIREFRREDGSWQAVSGFYTLGF